MISDLLVRSIILPSKTSVTFQARSRPAVMHYSTTTTTLPRTYSSSSMTIVPQLTLLLLAVCRGCSLQINIHPLQKGVTRIKDLPLPINSGFATRQKTELLSSNLEADSSSIDKDTNFSPSKARFLLGICSFLNGCSYVFTKMLEEAVPASLLTFFRFTISSIFFIPTLLTMKADRRVLTGAISIGISQFLGFGTQVVALSHSSAAKVAFFSCLSVVMCPLFDLLSNTKRDKDAPAPDFFGPVMALLGVAFLEFSGTEPVQWTDILILIAPLSFVSGFRKSEQLAKDYPGVIMFNTGVQMVTVSILSLLWSLASKDFPFSYNALGILGRKLSQWQIALGLLYAGIVTTTWTQLTEQNAIRAISAGSVALMYTLEPLFAAGISAVLLGERIGANTIVGASFITTACIWSALELTPRRVIGAIRSRFNKKDVQVASVI